MPQSFKDKSGQTYDVEVTVGTVKRVKAALKVDLLEVLGGGGELLGRMRDDPVFLVDLVYVVVKPQADARGVDDEAFGESMTGQSIGDAAAALMEAIVSFCPSPKDRATLGAILRATEAAMDRARDTVAARVAGLDVDGIVDAALRDAPGPSSGSAPESPASIPIPSHSGS